MEHEDYEECRVSSPEEEKITISCIDRDSNELVKFEIKMANVKRTPMVGR